MIFVKNSMWGIIYFLLTSVVIITAVSMMGSSQVDSISAIPPEVAMYSSDWPVANKDYANTRATNDSPINSSNVLDLGVAWSFPIPGISAYGAGASNPLIQGEKVFFQDLQGNVFCLDLASGEVLWEKIYNSTSVVGPNGPAAGWGKVFLAKDLYNMTALDLASGEELWSIRLSEVSTTGIDIQPALYDGMVYTSTVPGTGDVFYAPGGIGVIYALDQETGEVKWNFSTVDTPELWGHPEINSGGGCWFTPSIDLATGVMFWAIANPAPFPGTEDWPSGSSRPGHNLYTNTMMALNHSSGEMVWYRQVLPHDLLDHDLQIAPILATLDMEGGGEMEDLVIGAGKMGKVYAFNRSTGELLWVTTVGRYTEESQLDRLPEGTSHIYPGVLGGVETPMAYSSGMLFVPVVNLPADWTPTELDVSTLDFSQGRGELVALDARTGKILWIRHFDSMVLGGATVVNDLVFAATYDGNIYAFNAQSGERLLKYQAPAGINGWPAVAGDTVIWPAGMGSSPSLIALRLGASDNSPQAQIVDPGDGDVIQADNLTVTVQVDNFNLTDRLGEANVSGEGHIHYYMDVEVPTMPGETAASGPGTYVASSVDSHLWTALAPGMHNLSIQLVNNDHTPLVPPVTDRVVVNVVGMPEPSEAVPRGAVDTSLNVTDESDEEILAVPAQNASSEEPQMEVSPANLSQNVTVDLVAVGISFNMKTITVPAGAHVVVNFDNRDSGIPHNFAVYDTPSMGRDIFVGPIIFGPGKTIYEFDAPQEPGTYHFQCDPHANIMKGDFIVQ